MPDADIGLARGASVPFFDVTTTDGRRVRYDELWQRRALLLLSVPEDADAGVAASLRARVGHDAEVVVTADALPGLSHPGVWWRIGGARSSTWRRSASWTRRISRSGSASS